MANALQNYVLYFTPFFYEPRGGATSSCLQLPFLTADQTSALSALEGAEPMTPQASHDLHEEQKESVPIRGIENPEWAPVQRPTALTTDSIDIFV